jgi:hypothetical protein
MNWRLSDRRNRNVRAVPVERDRLSEMLRRGARETAIPPRPIDPSISLPRVSLIEQEWGSAAEKANKEALQRELESF